MKGNDDASFVDLDQLIERVNYSTTKQSIQFSLRALIKRGYIVRSEKTETRRKKARRLLMPTAKAFEHYTLYVGKL